MSSYERRTTSTILISLVMACAVTATAAAQTEYPVMRPDRETRARWIAAYLAADELKLKGIEKRGSVNLLPHLDYVPADRDQHSCGNCWVWAGTGCMEIAHDVEDSVFDRLSIQLFNSCRSNGSGSDYACCGGSLSEFADFYRSLEFCIPWSNTNAFWQDGWAPCNNGQGHTTVDCSDINTIRIYGITNIDDVRIATQGQNQATAIANIKAALNNDQAVYFAFYLPDFTPFFNFWNSATETDVWDFDYCCGTSYGGPNSSGHAVLCVGYNDDDPNNSYWVMVNSWGTANGGRPNGVFRVDMDMNYSCSLPGLKAESGSYSLYWQVLDVDFDNAHQGYHPLSCVNQHGDDRCWISGEYREPFGNHGIRMSEGGGACWVRYCFTLPHPPTGTNYENFVREGSLKVGLELAVWGWLFDGPDLYIWNWDTSSFDNLTMNCGNDDALIWEWWTVTPSNSHVSDNGEVWVQVYVDGIFDVVLDDVRVLFEAADESIASATQTTRDDCCGDGQADGVNVRIDANVGGPGDGLTVPVSADVYLIPPGGDKDDAVDSGTISWTITGQQSESQTVSLSACDATVNGEYLVLVELYDDACPGCEPPYNLEDQATIPVMLYPACEAETVSTPNTPSGPTSLDVDESGTYTTGGSQSSEGHAVEYRFDWGGGDYSTWGSATRSHSWSSPGVRCVRAQARCTIHTDAVSPWSACLNVTVSGGGGGATLDYSIMCDWAGPECGQHGPPKTVFDFGDQAWSYSDISGTGEGGVITWKWIWQGQIRFTGQWTIPEPWTSVCCWMARTPDQPGSWRVDLEYNGEYIGSGPTFIVNCAHPGPLLGYWSFDDCTGADESGNGMDGTVSGATCVGGPEDCGSGFEFAGSARHDSARIRRLCRHGRDCGRLGVLERLRAGELRF